MLINSDFDITIQKVVSANRLYNYVSEHPVYRHHRKRWAVALKNSGTTYYTANGKEILSDRYHPVILPKGSDYSWICTEPGECLLIEFDAPQECSDVYSFELSDTGFFVRDFYLIQSALYVSTPESRLEAMHKLYGILLQLVKTISKEYVPKEKRRLLQPAIRYISENYHDPDITNSQLAERCGISTVYFRKCFVSVLGVSPIRYLHNYRTQKAKDILSSDFASIEQVAENVGYNSVYHFSKMFKIYTGMSPSEYIKASRK